MLYFERTTIWTPRLEVAQELHHGMLQGVRMGGTLLALRPIVEFLSDYSKVKLPVTVSRKTTKTYTKKKKKPWKNAPHPTNVAVPKFWCPSNDQTKTARDVKMAGDVRPRGMQSIHSAWTLQRLLDTTATLKLDRVGGHRNRVVAI